MSVPVERDPHLEGWREVKAAALAACGRPIVGYAIVAVSESGEVFWGANYPDAATRTAIKQWAAIIAKDAAEQAKRERKA